MTLEMKRSLSRALRVALAASAFAVVPYAASPRGLEIPRAEADDTSATAEVMVLHATQVEGKGSIDPRIGNLPQLKKPPFSAFNTYKLLDKKDLSLQKGKGTTYALQNGRLLEITLVERGADKRIKVVARIIDGKTGRDFLRSEVTATPGEPFFLAGQGYEGGTLVVGITPKA